MKRFVLGLGCVLAMVPGVASAALSLATGDIEVKKGQIPTGEQFVDLVFSEPGTNVNEGLFAYDLYVTRDNPVISLVRAEKPADNWVFKAAGASFQQSDEFSKLPGLIVANAIGDLLGQTQDILDGTKAARVFFTIDPNAAPGKYHINLDPSPGSTVFVSGDTGEPFAVDISDPGTVTVTPEPTSLSLLGIAGVLALRRRRSA